MQHITKDQVLAELGRHLGQAKGIHVKDLVMHLTGELATSEAMERGVRKLVTELRLEGNPICAHPAHGYFLAETPAELEHTCNFLRSRALSSLVAYNRLKKISVNQLQRNLLEPSAPTSHSTEPQEETYDEQ
jgi:hypothetical protein